MPLAPGSDTPVRRPVSDEKKPDRITQTANLLIDELRDGKAYSPQPEEKYIQREERAEKANLLNIMLDRVLGDNSEANLTDIEKKCIRLKCMADASSKEIAQMYNMTVTYVDTTTHRARKKIRKYFESEGLLQDLKEMEILSDD